MANSLILRSQTVATIPNRPKFTRDPMVRPGTKFLFDFSRPVIHPEGQITAGAATGKQFVDLSGGDVPLVFPGAAGWTVNADGSVTNTAGAASASIGSVGQFNMFGAPYDFVTTYWFKLPAAHPTGSLKYMLHYAAATPNAGQFALYVSGTSGRQCAGYANGQSAGPSGADISLDEPHMLALHRSYSTERLALFLDGVKSWDIPATNLPVDLAAYAVTLSGVAERTTYRMSLCDIAASMEAEAEMGYNPNAILTAEQHIAREWQFCNNQIASAPKATYV